MTRFTVRDKLLVNAAVAGATVEIDPPAAGPAAISGVTNRLGRVDLVTTGLANGQHTVRITSASSSSDPVGPTTASTAAPPARIHRTYSFTIQTTAGAVTAVAPPPGNRHGTAQRQGTNVMARLQPVWMASPNHRARGTTPSMIIIHHTGGSLVGPALNTFLGAGTSAHYVIDTDGQIIKMVQDGRRANHAGVARWAGARDINSRSIGIEIVHATTDGNYPESQYVALLGLLARIRTAFPSIPARNIVGHNDVGTNASGRLGRKSSDPGLHFDWARLEANQLGLLQALGPWPSNLYGGFFDQVANGAFRRGDNDTSRRFGGANRATVTGNPVEEIQQDLANIGYSVGTPDGDYGSMTHYAVLIFQEHFFGGGRGHKAPDGRVDYQTATLIKSII